MCMLISGRNHISGRHPSTQVYKIHGHMVFGLNWNPITRRVLGLEIRVRVGIPGTEIIGYHRISRHLPNTGTKVTGTEVRL
jgi:hypothetical protein